MFASDWKFTARASRAGFCPADFVNFGWLFHRVLSIGDFGRCVWPCTGFSALDELSFALPIAIESKLSDAGVPRQVVDHPIVKIQMVRVPHTRQKLARSSTSQSAISISPSRDVLGLFRIGQD